MASDHGGAGDEWAGIMAPPLGRRYAMPWGYTDAMVLLQISRVWRGIDLCR